MRHLCAEIVRGDVTPSQEAFTVLNIHCRCCCLSRAQLEVCGSKVAILAGKHNRLDLIVELLVDCQPRLVKVTAFRFDNH